MFDLHVTTAQLLLSLSCHSGEIRQVEGTSPEEAITSLTDNSKKAVNMMSLIPLASKSSRTSYEMLCTYQGNDQSLLSTFK